MEGRFARLHYVPVEVAMTYEVLDLVLQIISLLDIVPIVMVEATITSAVPVLYSRPHRVGSFEESLLLDLEKNLSPSGVERDIDDRGTIYSPLSVLLLGSPGGGPQEGSARGCF
ncbi:hypothetical protein B296_00007115 [Ensete ventricosum]|uniref:Uncharacterized protein n=1 Tax=Ensete ventricosum TaxID=4639 RepID=A0A427AR36_ENSVE|nr:hypothetical protein B296_00007115 [Ensete ventricosum]